jgi:TRAP-type uncharacterized transport system substrate-binding protein
MRNRFGVIGILVGVVALMAAACGSDAPPVVIEKEVQVVVTATPTALPPTATPVDPATVTANFLLIEGGTRAFFIEAMREMIIRGTNGRITMTPQDGTPEDAIDYIINNPDKYDELIFRTADEHAILWDLGIPSARSAVITPRPMALWTIYPTACATIFTLDPEIKTVHDLAGKRVNTGRPAYQWDYIGRELFKAAGLTLDVVTSTGKKSNEVLQDREVDAISYGFLFADSKTASINPVMHNVAQVTGSLHTVDFTEELINDVAAANPVWAERGLMQPVKYLKGGIRTAANVEYDINRTDGYCANGTSQLYLTSPNVSEEVVYQMTKSMIDYRDLGDEYFPFMSANWKERLGQSWAKQELYHPGARRAYEEAGVEYGLEGTRAWESANPQG